jgi:hypothetical protein
MIHHLQNDRYHNIMYSIIYFPFHAKGRCHQYEMAQQRQAAVGKMLPYL